MSDMSLVEVEALVAKAARGVGLPWGLAAEAGKAARRAIAANTPGAGEAFLAWLETTAGREDCPLVAGLRDRDLSEPDDACADIVYRSVVENALVLARRRARLSDEVLERMNALAHRTYAPATEESRARGAG
ncbi:MAG: DUF3726 domain-containing protein [Pseudomonadota bacterium]